MRRVLALSLSSVVLGALSSACSSGSSPVQNSTGMQGSDSAGGGMGLAVDSGNSEDAGNPGNPVTDAGTSADTGGSTSPQVDSGAAQGGGHDASIDATSDTGNVADVGVDAPLVEAPGGSVNGFGSVEFDSTGSHDIVRLQTTLAVPAEPPPSGTLFLWPGLQPTGSGANFNPIGNGVLQPVLTWGTSCAPGNQPPAHSTWWVSAQYVNTDGNDPGYMGCYGGPVMSVAVGDELAMDMNLSGTVWKQTVTDNQSGMQVSFSEDLMGQAQGRGLWIIETPSSNPISDVVFTNTTITFSSADAAGCALLHRGTNDFVSTPRLSSDGTQCFIDEMVLRAQGIPADM